MCKKKLRLEVITCRGFNNDRWWWATPNSIRWRYVWQPNKSWTWHVVVHFLIIHILFKLMTMTKTSVFNDSHTLTNVTLRPQSRIGENQQFKRFFHNNNYIWNVQHKHLRDESDKFCDSAFFTLKIVIGVFVLFAYGSYERLTRFFIFCF